MNTRVNTERPIDSDLLATDAFTDPTYRDAALKVANRIRHEVGLPEADRMLAGYRGDVRWGNPVVFTIGAGAPSLVAHLEDDQRRIVVDSLKGVRTFCLIQGSVVAGFLDRFEAGRYPELEA